MTTDERTALAVATRHRVETTRERARTAPRRLDRDGSPVTFAAVALVAGVSRSLLYRDPDLRAEIDRLRTATRLEPPGHPPPSGPATPRSNRGWLRHCTTVRRHLG